MTSAGDRSSEVPTKVSCNVKIHSTTNRAENNEFGVNAADDDNDNDNDNDNDTAYWPPCCQAVVVIAEVDTCMASSAKCRDLNAVR